MKTYILNGQPVTREEFLRGPEEDEFTKEVEKFNRAGVLTVFNVKEAYFRLVKYPEPCPGCTRSGRDHKGDCPVAYQELD